MDVIVTPRLRLRTWREMDLEPFAAMNDDPVVMEHYPHRLNGEETRAMIGRIEDHFARHGFGLWAVGVPEVADFIGYVGLSVPDIRSGVHAVRRDRMAARRPGTGGRATRPKRLGRR